MWKVELVVARRENQEFEQQFIARRKARKHCHELGVRGRRTEPGKTIKGVVDNIQRRPWNNQTYLAPETLTQVEPPAVTGYPD